MIKLTRTLLIRSINGRNGPFAVGRLQTEIGEFAVKDTLLDQYDEGRYEGEFGVSRIYPTHYLAGSRLVVEIRAVLETMALANIDALPSAERDAPPEPDPIDTDPSAPVAATLPEPQDSGSAPAATTVGDPPAESAATDDDEALFGTLWPIGDIVKLDATVDRQRFRDQRERLKAMGYRFQAVGQQWVKNAA